MDLRPVKGMRDFYPQEMALRNWIVARWHDVSRRHGFVEYDGPILEPLELYTLKSGDEIVEQLFSLTDRGGRHLAIRPEMTPTLARMIAARAASLPKPIKWYSIPRLCRTENVQRGRLREFFQWNIDIVGIDDPLADAETIFVAIDFFRDVGLSPALVEMRISSRRLLTAILADIGIPPPLQTGLFSLLDRRDRLSPDEFDARLRERITDASLRDALQRAQAAPDLPALRQARPWSDPVLTALDELQAVFAHLDAFGVGEYCRLDLGIVRGLAYYTGVVFEAYGRKGLRRAICGGGRYDDLLALVGGPRLPGVGFATSDVVIEDILKDADLLPDLRHTLDVFVCAAATDLMPTVLRLVAALRHAGLATDYAYRPAKLARQLRTASDRHAAFAIIVGEETTTRGIVGLKDLATGQQRDVALDDLLRSPRDFITPRPPQGAAHAPSSL